MAQVDTVLNDFILNVLSEEEFQNLAEKDGNQLYFTDLIEYYTKEEARALMTLFRGQFANWESVPTSIADYASDFAGSKTPTQNNFMVVKDASGYATDVCDILNHVQSTGTQYINLGIIPTVGMKYVVNFQASDSTTGTIFGTDGCDMHVYQGEKNPVTEINIGTTTELNGIGVSSGFNINYELTIKANGVSSKASNVTISNPYKGNLPATEMYLLAKNTADVATDFSACIVKGFKVYEGENLLMDLVPARRVLDGAIGFVDVTTNIFYENLGTDPLIAGDVVSAAETPNDINGSWMFIYNGKWNDNGKSGWTPACALGGGTGGAGVDSVNGKTGTVNLTANDVNAYTKEEVDAKVGSGGTMPARYVAAINGFTGEVFLGCREIGTYTTDEIDEKIAKLNDKADIAAVDAISSRVSTLEGYDYVVAEQKPNASNNYTWFRKYKSGWVEQGGRYVNQSFTGGQATLTATLPIPITMTSVIASPEYVSGDSVVVVTSWSTETTVSTIVERNNISSTLNTVASARWVVFGNAQ